MMNWLDDIPTIDYDEMNGKTGKVLVLKDAENFSVVVFHSDDDTYYVLATVEDEK